MHAWLGNQTDDAPRTRWFLCHVDESPSDTGTYTILEVGILVAYVSWSQFIEAIGTHIIPLYHCNTRLIMIYMMLSFYINILAPKYFQMKMLEL